MAVWFGRYSGCHSSQDGSQIFFLNVTYIDNEMVRALALQISPWTLLLNELQFLFAQINSTYHQTNDEISREQKILQLCKKDPRYFAPIYEKYYEQIFMFVFKRVDEEESTADVTSKVFLKCLRNIDRYQFRGVPFSAWLYRIAINEVNQYFRDEKKKERVVSLETHHINVLFEEMNLLDMDEEPEVLVARLLSHLKPEEVQYLELRFFEGRSFKEMGFLLQVTEVNAKVKTYRILKKLRVRAEELMLVKK